MSTRAIVLSGPFHGRVYEAALVQTDVSVEGHDLQEIRLELTVREHTPQDVSCRLDHGEAVCESRSGREVELERMTVRLPRQTALRLRTVSGDIRVTGLKGSPFLSFRTVSGDMELKDGREIGEVSGHSVSGEVRMDRCQVKEASVKTVSGDVQLDGSELGHLRFDSVSGEVRKTDSKVGQERARNIGDLGAHLAKKVARHVKIRVEKS